MLKKMFATVLFGVCCAQSYSALKAHSDIQVPYMIDSNREQEYKDLFKKVLNARDIKYKSIIYHVILLWNGLIVIYVEIPDKKCEKSENIKRYHLKKEDQESIKYLFNKLPLDIIKRGSKCGVITLEMNINDKDPDIKFRLLEK